MEERIGSNKFQAYPFSNVLCIHCDLPVTM